MTADEALIDIAGRIERDLWNDLAAVPPESWLVRDICALAAQLTISQESSRIHGTPLVYAKAFVEQTDALALKIDKIGGEKRINRSLLWMQFVEFENFAMALLDLMVSCGL